MYIQSDLISYLACVPPSTGFPREAEHLPSQKESVYNLYKCADIMFDDLNESQQNQAGS